MITKDKAQANIYTLTAAHVARRDLMLTSRVGHTYAVRPTRVQPDQYYIQATDSNRVFAGYYTDSKGSV